MLTGSFEFKTRNIRLRQLIFLSNWRRATNELTPESALVLNCLTAIKTKETASWQMRLRQDNRREPVSAASKLVLTWMLSSYRSWEPVAGTSWENCQRLWSLKSASKSAQDLAVASPAATNSLERNRTYSLYGCLHNHRDVFPFFFWGLTVDRSNNI